MPVSVFLLSSCNGMYCNGKFTYCIPNNKEIRKNCKTMLPGRKLHVSLKVRSKEIILKKKVCYYSFSQFELCAFVCEK